MFYAKKNRIHSLMNLGTGSLGLPEVIEVPEATWPSGNRVDGRPSRLFPCSSDKCCLCNFLLDVPEREMDVHWSPGTFWVLRSWAWSEFSWKLQNSLFLEDREGSERPPLLFFKLPGRLYSSFWAHIENGKRISNFLPFSRAQSPTAMQESNLFWPHLKLQWDLIKFPLLVHFEAPLFTTPAVSS